MNLRPETLAEIEAAIPKYPDKRSAVMPLLHAIQKDQGYLSNEAAEWVGEKLGVSAMSVLSVITFYPYYRQHPIGKRHIRVCRTLSCAMAGASKVCEAMLDEFKTGINQTSPDGEVTIEYAEMTKRRAARRMLQFEVAAAQEAALRGLVRTLLVDER